MMQTILVALSAFAVTAVPSIAQAQGGPVSQQTARPPLAVWLTIIPIAAASESGPAGAVGLSFQRRRLLVSTRLALAEGPPCSGDCWPDSVDLSLLAGYASPVGQRIHLSAAVGAGVASYRGTGGFGLSLESQAAFRPTRVVGFGLYGWANTFGPQGGLGLGVHIGRLR